MPCSNIIATELSQGFLPVEDPLQHLPSAFSIWEDTAHQLPKLLLCGHIRQHIEQLPAFDFAQLASAKELERAMMILSFLGHAYVWGQTTVAEKIPANLAMPWYHISQLLGRPPVLSYASYALHNWRRLDDKKPIALGNIVLLQNFLAGLDEEWFVLVHIDIEAKAIPVIKAIPQALKAVKAGDSCGLEKQLKTIVSGQKLMLDSLKKMPLHCDPYIYFNRIRPYIFGWKDNPALASGLIYRGVCDYKQQGQNFRGETGAQSTIIPSLDVFLGIKHGADRLQSYLLEMRDYMPVEHRTFIIEIEQGPDLRAFVKKQSSANPGLCQAYNDCIEMLDLFRRQHLEYATSYIASQHATSPANSTSVGTGGTPFMPYLQKHQNDTHSFKIRSGIASHDI
ncbi:MAG: hypothetical protein HRU20_13505 [Pseudomonadales bacterium]|nr:hypothetical protein [Pseudomonadales bacterium]